MSAPTWTREQILDAIQRWAALHGRPPKAAEWKRRDRGDEWPAAGVVQRFGWANMIEEAGFPRPVYYAPVAPENRSVRLERPDDRPFPINGVEAARFGTVVTFENDDEERLVLHQTGAVRPSILEAIDHALTLDVTFRVVCVSTPTSVFRDLQGDRVLKGYARPHFPELASVPRNRLHPSLTAGGLA